MAGAAGRAALVTTVQDTARFLDALLKGSLFRHRHTLRQMLAFAPAPDVDGEVGNGLGIERRLLPGGVEAIGHLGISVGYCAYVARLRPQRVTMSLALNRADDPTPLLVPAIQALAAAHRSVSANGQPPSPRRAGWSRVSEFVEAVEDQVESEHELGRVVVAGLSDVPPTTSTRCG